MWLALTYIKSHLYLSNLALKKDLGGLKRAKPQVLGLEANALIN